MPRDAEKVRRRLQEAALALYAERGYEQTTAAEIAAEAGVTERTFFRHFTDKREVLFDGESELRAILTEAVGKAPPALAPLAILLHAFRKAHDLLLKNRRFAEPRRRVIASSSLLQERELIKAMALSTALASALHTRGVPDRLSSLAVQIGMAAFSQAFSSWLDGGLDDLNEHLEQAFRDVRELSSSG